MANEVNDGSDKVERINQGDRTSENTSKDSIIGGDRKDHQQIHQEASKAGHTFDTFSDNDNDQSFKAIQPAADSFGIDFGDGTIETAKGIVSKPTSQDAFEQKGQEVLAAAQRLKPPSPDSISLGGHNYRPDQLIAANVTNNPIRSDATLPTSEEMKEPELPDDSVAWGEDSLIPRVTMPSAGDRVVFPYRGFEDQHLSKCTKDNPQAWNQAFTAFPELSQYLSGEEGTTLMKAIVRNELHNFDLKDGLGDTLAKLGHPDTSETLGYSQITPTGVKEFCNRYPQLKEFISKRHSGANAEADALRDPACIPMIVAAKLQSEVDFYKSASDKLQPGERIPINARTLAYAYNADVYYNPNNSENPDFHPLPMPKAKEFEKLRGYEKAYPTSDERVLSKSEHLKNVEEQMALFR